jgi:hypothetical protein
MKIADFVKAACVVCLALGIAAAQDSKPRTATPSPPVWHRSAKLVAGAGDWTVTIQTAQPLPDAAGYHSVGANAVPFAIVGQQGQYNWTQVLSHEIIEMLIDPFPAAIAGPSGARPLEPCDPVVGESYAIDGVAVADFVYPAWFLQSTLAHPSQLDFLDTHGLRALWDTR